MAPPRSAEASDKTTASKGSICFAVSINLRQKDLALAGSAAAASNFAQMSWELPALKTAPTDGNGGSLLSQSTGTVASHVRFAEMGDGGEQ